jgi:hypothetical protein
MGPFYFNELGPDPEAFETDASGRFCFFNVSPGLIEVNLFDGEQLVAASAIPVLKLVCILTTACTLAMDLGFELHLAALTICYQSSFTMTLRSSFAYRACRFCRVFNESAYNEVLPQDRAKHSFC